MTTERHLLLDFPLWEIGHDEIVQYQRNDIIRSSFAKVSLEYGVSEILKQEELRDRAVKMLCQSLHERYCGSYYERGNGNGEKHKPEVFYSR